MGNLENNKLIAEFMGWTEGIDEGGMFGKPCKAWRNTDNLDNLLGYCDGYVRIGSEKFHSSWDWLMPVVERISKILDSEDSPLDALFEEENEEAMDYYVEFNEVSLLDLNITDLYNTIVEFIKWYNKTKKQ